MIAPVLAHDPTDFPFPADCLELVSDFLHPPFHGFVVCVDALFPTRHEPGPLPDVALVDPFPQEGDLVMKEGQFDLELPFPARGALREQLEEHAEAVVAFHVQLPLEDVVHRRPELSVEYDHIDVVPGDPFADLIELAAADERARVRVVPTLDDRLDDAVACGPHEGRDLRDVGVQGDQEDVQQTSEAASAA